MSLTQMETTEEIISRTKTQRTIVESRLVETNKDFKHLEDCIDSVDVKLVSIKITKTVEPNHVHVKNIITCKLVTYQYCMN